MDDLKNGPNKDGSFTVTLTKNEQVLVTQVLLMVVKGKEWDWPESYHGGMGPDRCEGCSILMKLGAFGGRTASQIRESM